jgi:hypothetical protein
MIEVRRTSAASILNRVFLAIVIAVGTSGGAFASLFCSTDMCGSTCSMHAKTKAKPVSCCDEQPVSQQDGSGADESCKCQLKSAPIANPAPTVAPSISIPIEISMPLAPPVCLLTEPEFIASPILFQGDSSPPIVVRQPDLGRAPPAQ